MRRCLISRTSVRWCSKVRVAIATAMLLSSAYPAYAQTASLPNISQQVFACMKRNPSSPAGRVTYSEGDTGRIRVFVGAAQVGEVSYTFDANQNTLSVTFVRGPATLTQVRDGLNRTATLCRTNVLR